MKTLFALAFWMITFISFGQKTEDIFTHTDYDYTYLGIDYSNAKFIGDFSQFAELGNVGHSRIKNEYFDRWNRVVISEPDKYNLEAMLRKDYIEADLSMIRKVNESTAIEDMEARRPVELDLKAIEKIVKEYDLKKMEGVGILFIAEYLDKNRSEACFHFVAINMKSKKVLLHKRMIKEAGGFGLRNYWIKPIYQSIQQITKYTWFSWKKKYKNK